MSDDLRDAKRQFLEWEKRSRDVIDVKQVYVIVAGDLVGADRVLAIAQVLNVLVRWLLAGRPKEDGQ